MSIPAERMDGEKYYTYDDWRNLGEHVRAELVDGQLFMMSSPSRRHQAVLVALIRQLGDFLEGKTCEVYPAPFDVRLHQNKDTVLQPDIVVVCDPSKLNDFGCEGAPDLVVEILSPSTAGYDKFKKFYQYLKAGVKEYWLVDPEYRTVTAHKLSDGKYVTDEYYYPETATVPAVVLPGCEIDLKRVFSYFISEGTE